MAHLLLIFFFWMLFLPSAMAEETAVLIADFNQREAVSNLDTPFEVWLRGDGSDPTQTCRMSFAGDDALGDEAGYSLRLDYDVDSPNPAYNGMRIYLEGFDASGFQNLNFYLKGDASQGFPKRLKVELIDSSKRPSPYILDGITEEWQKFTIPLSEFWAVRDWSSLEQFVIVFADINNDPKVGTIYLDHVHFSG